MKPELIALFIGAYFLGAIPVGVLVARAHGVDILSFGSGNPGATNVGRAIGNRGFAIVMALDSLKGLLPVLAARAIVVSPVGLLSPQVLWFLVGLAAVLGHCLSPFIRFRGGKGIATSLGVLLAAAPWVALGAFVVWMLVFAASRFVSLASIAAAIAIIPLGAFLPDQAPALVPVYVALGGFVVFRHRDNLVRLRNGTEKRYQPKAKPLPPA